MEKICRRVLMKNINILHAYSIFSFLLSYFIHLFILNIYFHCRVPDQEWSFQDGGL